MQPDLPLYGIDWNGPVPNAEEANGVDVSVTKNPLEE